MRVPPPNLDPARLVEVLAQGWGFAARSLEYQPVGFGSHHWLAMDGAGRRRFVTVDVLTSAGGQADLDRLTAAFSTAYALRHDAGLERVLAPLPAHDGAPLRLLRPGFVVTVFEHLDAQPWPEEPQATGDDNRQVAELLAGVHAGTDSVRELAGVDDLAIPHRPGLERRVADVDAPWSGGPYTVRARALLADRRAAVVSALRSYDLAAGLLREEKPTWVLTHGEPHSDNLLRTAAGPVLLDWDTALVAPAGRDLWMLSAVGVAHYRAMTGHGVPDEELDAFRLRWDLAEVAEYIRWFSGPHEADEDTQIGWGGLVESLDNLAERAGRPARSGGGGI